MDDIMLALGPYGVYYFKNAGIGNWSLNVKSAEVIRGVGLRLSSGPSKGHGSLDFSFCSDAFVFPGFDSRIREKKVKDCTNLELFFAVRERTRRDNG